MQIGIDVGATKIESVVLEEDGNEIHGYNECEDHRAIGDKPIPNLLVNELFRWFD